MSFFDQLDQCLQQQQQRNQRAPEGTPSPSWEPMDPSIATQASTSKTSRQAARPDYCGTQDQNSQTHLCKEVSKNSNGSTTGRGARDISNFRRDNERDRLYESSVSWSHQGRSESRTHQGISEATPCWTDQGDSTDI